MVEEVLFEGNLKETTEYQYSKNKKIINGLPNYILDLREHIPVASSQFCEDSSHDSETRWEVSFKNFTAGTVVAIRWVGLLHICAGWWWGIVCMGVLFRDFSP